MLGGGGTRVYVQHVHARRIHKGSRLDQGPQYNVDLEGPVAVSGSSSSLLIL